MENKFIWLFIAILLILPVVTADGYELGTYKIDSCINLPQTADATFCNITGIYDPTNAMLITPPVEMEKAGTAFNYTFCDTATPGKYTVQGVCDTDVWVYNFMITKSGGMENTDSTMTIFIFILFILAVVGLFYTFFLCLTKLITGTETVYGVLITWSFFILMLIVNYMGQEYLFNTFVTSLSGTLITITAWTNVVLPLTSLIISMFIRSTQKKKPLSAQELGGFKYG